MITHGEFNATYHSYIVMSKVSMATIQNWNKFRLNQVFRCSKVIFHSQN